MPHQIIFNASPLIFLSRVDGVTWLSDICLGGVEVPRGVVQELPVGEDGQNVLDVMQSEERIRLVDDCAVPLAVAAWDLGKGETQVLAHCLAQPGALAVLDDGAARQCARSLGISVVGTLGIVLAARRMGWIVAARPVVEQPVHDGLYLSSSLIAAALREVRE